MKFNPSFTASGCFDTRGPLIRSKPILAMLTEPEEDLIVPDCLDIALCLLMARVKGRRVVSLPPLGTDG